MVLDRKGFATMHSRMHRHQRAPVLARLPQPTAAAAGPTAAQQREGAGRMIGLVLRLFR